MHPERAILPAGLFAGALVISLYLAWQAFAGQRVAGCGPESSCNDVLNSRWAVVLGIPVSVFGVLLYGFLLGCAVRKQPMSPSLLRLRGIACYVVLAGALWFTFAQAALLKAFCPWCCTAHGLASLAVVLDWMSGPKETATPKVAKSSPAFFAGVATALVAAMVAIQAAGPAPELIERKEITGGGSTGAEEIEIDPAELPWLGAPNAEVTGIVLTDYTCPHCRELHQTLVEAGGQLDGRFGAVVLPGYRDAAARELHRTMLALWRIDPVEYQRLSLAMVEGGLKPDPAAVMNALPKAVGDRFYQSAWKHGRWIEDTMRLGENLAARNEERLEIATLPQLMIAREVISGAPRLETVVAMAKAAPAGLPTLIGERAARVASSDPKVAPKPESGSGPKIEFVKSTVDLGKVDKGEVPQATFEFRNTGDAPLELTKLKPQCGCTTIAGWKQTVAPGKTGSFHVKFATAKFNGNVTKSIDYETNAEGGNGKLFVKVNVWTPVLVSPSMVSFGAAIKGRSVLPRTVQIAVQDGRTIDPGEIRCSNPYFVCEMMTVEEGKSYTIQVSVPELGEKVERGELVVPLGHPTFKEAKLQLFANPVDPVMVQPKEIMRLDRVLTASNVMVTVYCYDPKVREFLVSDVVYTGSQDVNPKLEMRPRNRWGRIQMTFPPNFDVAAAEAEGAKVTFKTNHPDFPEYSVPIRHVRRPN